MTKNNKINILFNIDKRVDDRNIKNIIIYYIKSLLNNGNIINYRYFHIFYLLIFTFYFN